MLNNYFNTSQSNLKVHKTLTYDILDGMVDWVRVVDSTGIVIYVNKSMRESLGIDIIGSRCYSSLGKNCACKRCITQTTIATGMPSEKEERIGDRIYSVKSSPVKNVDGNIYASVEVFRDVTRERKLENEILEKNNKMNKDLEFARTLQHKILPKKGKYGAIDIDYIYKPSEHLSGDIFDILNINDDLTGIYISDVVGHGVTASMMTMFITQTMRGLKENKLSPSKTLKELHKRFFELGLDDDKYFTIFYGIIDKRKNTFTYCNAGHNSPPIVISDKVTSLEIPGFPITNLFEEVDYEEEEIKLKENDEIILFTDGVIECRNKDGEEFGIERIIELAKEKEENNIIYKIYEATSKYNYNISEDDFAIVKATFKSCI